MQISRCNARASTSARAAQVCLILLVTLLGSSCDGRPKRAGISGKVLIDGQPLTIGVVQFIPPDTRPSMGRIQEDGSFTMICYGDDDGAILGTHRVAIIATEILSPSKIKWHAPKKYSDPSTSGLTITVEKSRDDVNFELTWDGGKPFIEVSGRASEEMGDDV